MRKTKLLFAAALSMIAWTGVMAQTDAEYEAAMAAITDGATYRIFTSVESTPYYVTVDGALTSVKDNAGLFTLTKVDGGAFKPTGIQVSSGSKRFTNPPLSDGVANLNPGSFSTSTNNRAQWETQVFFLNTDDKYAIRSCNTTYGESSWEDAGRTFWTYSVEPVAPLYSYEAAFVWELEVAAVINVKYTLVEADGTEVTSVTMKQEGGSDIAVPTQLVNQPLLYDYEVTGTIGNEDCEIVITRTMKSGVVTALTDLSNDKAYTIRCDRGALLTKDGTIASTSHSELTDAEPTPFAVINYEDNYYLYSVVDSKFVLNNGSLAEMPTNGVYDAIIMDPKTTPYFMFSFKINEETSYGLNMNGSGDLWGIVINSWMNADAGNQYYMIEAADFDATEAVKALDTYFHPSYYVTYVVKDEAGNVIFTSDPIPTNKGAVITTLPANYQRAFCTYNEVEVTIEEQETTVEFTCTWNGPIVLADSYEDITWQNLYLNRGEENLWYLANGSTVPSFVNNPTEKQRASEFYQWGFVGNPYGLMIYNKATGDAQTLSYSTMAMAEEEFVWDQLVENAGGILIGTNGQYLNQSGGASSTKLGTWGSTTDMGSTFYVAEVPDIPVTNVYFDVVYNGRVIKSAVVGGLEIGDPLPAIPAELDNGLVTFGPVAGNVTKKNQHVDVEVTLKAPFELTANVYNAKWVNMTIRGDWDVFADEESEPYYPVHANNIQKLADNYQWAFAGNPYNLIVFNKAYGKGYSLTNEDGKAVMREGLYKWEVFANSDGFILREPGTANNCINQNGGGGGPLTFWNSGGALTDNGSTFRIFDVPTTVDVTITDAGFATLYAPVAVSRQVRSIAAPTGAWTFDDPENPTAGTGISTMSATEGVTFADGVATVPAGEYLTMVTGINTNELGTYSFMMDINLPAIGGWTALYQNDPTNTKDGSLFINKKGHIGLAGPLGYSEFTFEANTWYRVIFVAENSLPTVYVDGVKVIGPAASMSTPDHWTMHEAALFFADNDGEDSDILTSEIRFWNSALTPAQVEALGGAGAEEAGAKSVTAYTAKVNSNEWAKWITMAELESDIPAYTPVILEGEPGVYELSIIEDEVAPVEDNDLQGTLKDIEAAGKYVLAKPEDKEVGFYLAETGTLKAGKAYIEIPGPVDVKALFFSFDGEDPTGIANVESAVENGLIYNLAGQRLNKVQKGINIINGKKVLK